MPRRSLQCAAYLRKRKERKNDEAPFQFQEANGTGYKRFTGRENIFRFCPNDDGTFGIAQVEYSHGGNYYSMGNAIYSKKRINSTPWFYTEQRIIPNLTLLAGYSHAFSTEAECKDIFGLGALYKLGKYQIGAFTDCADFTERYEFATELSCKIPIFQHMDIQPAIHVNGIVLQCYAWIYPFKVPI